MSNPDLPIEMSWAPSTRRSGRPISDRAARETPSVSGVGAMLAAIVVAGAAMLAVILAASPTVATVLLLAVVTGPSLTVALALLCMPHLPRRRPQMSSPRPLSVAPPRPVTATWHA